MESRPECVRRLAAEFPLGTVVTAKGDDFYVIGWTETDEVIMSPVYPADDYDESMAKKTGCHAHHLRDGTAPFRKFTP